MSILDESTSARLRPSLVIPPRHLEQFRRYETWTAQEFADFKDQDDLLAEFDADCQHDTEAESFQPNAAASAGDNRLAIANDVGAGAGGPGGSRCGTDSENSRG